MPAKKTTIPKRLGRLPQVRAEYGLSKSTIYRMTTDGLVTLWKIGGASYWDLDEIGQLARPVTRRQPASGDAA
ncbi:MAG: hypothetical protein WCF04_06855 [Candidatus Nanopelagicales bacterium]